VKVEYMLEDVIKRQSCES